jgi:single-strand DNA-binding protein
MNKVILMGRLTRDPEMRNAGETTVARYSLAVDRRFSRDGEASADFFNCVAFGKSGEFAEKYFRKGTKVLVTGRLQTGSYTNRDGQKVNTVDIIVEDQEFAESKGSGTPEAAPAAKSSGSFMSIPDGSADELPFN